MIAYHHHHWHRDDVMPWLRLAGTLMLALAALMAIAALMFLAQSQSVSPTLFL